MRHSPDKSSSEAPAPNWSEAEYHQNGSATTRRILVVVHLDSRHQFHSLLLVIRFDGFLGIYARSAFCLTVKECSKQRQSQHDVTLGGDPAIGRCASGRGPEKVSQNDCSVDRREDSRGLPSLTCQL